MQSCFKISKEGLKICIYLRYIVLSCWDSCSALISVQMSKFVLGCFTILTVVSFWWLFLAEFTDLILGDIKSQMPVKFHQILNQKYFSSKACKGIIIIDCGETNYNQKYIAVIWISTVLVIFLILNLCHLLWRLWFFLSIKMRESNLAAQTRTCSWYLYFAVLRNFFLF